MLAPLRKGGGMPGSKAATQPTPKRGGGGFHRTSGLPGDEGWGAPQHQAGGC